MRVLPVIMSGGSGTRLWPASTDEKPKQFHALGSEATMLQDSVSRVRGEGFLDPLIICNARHAEQVRNQLDGAGVKAAELILEPFGRNTAAVAIIAALWAKTNAPDALVLLMPADHVISDADGFRSAVERASEHAAEMIVTFGIAPEGPETGYGYIQSGSSLGDGLARVARFVEKPDQQTARRYLAEGGYSWNAGIFLYAPMVLLSEAELHCNDILAPSKASFGSAERTASGLLLDGEAFARCPARPVDVAIMERTQKAAVLPVSVGWADIGSWSELWRYGAGDANDNVVKGDGIALDTTGSLLWTDGPSISIIGLSDIIVIASHGHILVLPKERAQDVKTIAQLRRQQA